MDESRIVPVFQALADDLHALGVRTVFGLMSDDTAVFAVTLDGLGVKFVGARHENNAIAMAEGYAYATGELGVALIGRGPATANGLHAAVAASRMGSKVLVVYGDAAVQSGAVNTIGPDYKGFNAQAVLGAAGLTCFTAGSPATARQTLRDAVAAANQGSLAALLLPTNVQMMNVEIWGETTPAPLAAGQPVSARAQSIDAVVALLAKSRRPMIVAGMGAHRAGAKAALEALADKTGALLMTSARGKDMFRGHPYNLGILGSFSHAMGRRMMDQADCVLVFGDSAGATHPGRFRAGPHRPVDDGGSGGGGRCQAGRRAAARRPARSAGRRQAVPQRGNAGQHRGLRHRARLRGRPHAAHRGSPRARSRARQAAAPRA
jgi:acetolactate synthase-1/2/3 large subunit